MKCRATASAPPPSFQPTTSSLATWEPLHLDTVRNLVMDSSSKSCELDLLPPFLVKEFIDDLAPFLLLLCNSSLAQGAVPTVHKRAVVFPSIKRQGLHLSALSCFRPVSNLSFLSKLLENASPLNYCNIWTLTLLCPRLNLGSGSSTPRRLSWLGS